MPLTTPRQPLRAPTLSRSAAPATGLAALTAIAALAGTASIAWAQPSTADSSRIVSVKVYQGSATVERVARVSAGTRTLRLSCLPPTLDAQSLQISATDASVRIGESNVQVLARELAGDCPHPLDARVREAQDQLALARADVDALKLAQDYLKTVATTAPPAASAAAGVAGTAALGSSTESLRRTALDTLTRLHQAQRKQENLQQALNLLVNQRSDNNTSVRDRMTTVTVTLAAERDAELRVSYQVPGPHWAPHYRATLSTGDAAAPRPNSSSTTANSPSVRLERLALLMQNTGEDWSNVQLVLATGQPQRNTTARLPPRWWLQVAPPPMGTNAADLPAYATAQAGARSYGEGPNMSIASATPQSGAPPDFAVQVNDAGFASEFTVPQRVSVPSATQQRMTLALGHVDASAQLVTRTTPAQEEAAYLVALLPTPPGVWPTAPVALYRDRQYVGQGQLNMANLPQLGLSFGRDERVRVRAEPLRENTASAGLTGARTERTQQRAYTVENRHSTPLNLQVLDAAPVSTTDKITIESRYTPVPTDTAWNQQTGNLLWAQSLPPGTTARIEVAHTVRYPKEVQLLEQR